MLSLSAIAAFVVPLLSALANAVVPIIQKEMGLAASKLWAINPMDVLQSWRVALCAAAGATVVHALDAVIPDGAMTIFAVGVVAAVLDTIYRLRKGA